ncbi:unnamed protein product [Pseudo-nitzschia multistriata]|uniref:SPRY domain-containing protein n=1 Tax=Pseudo-nitzschia multistriata TaxID=183589 RepID=A0A448ZQ47_9STRA|nr:unnamed protein product [Pseudo-nitzschia multistriata]
MGCCCSCDGKDGDKAIKESELVERETPQQTINVAMSNPSIQVTNHLCVTGSGLALIGTALEQDAAYWEYHVTLPARKHVDTILFGVSSKKDRKFYKEIDGKGGGEKEGVPSEGNGTSWMRCVEGLQNGDIVGIAMQQSGKLIFQLSDKRPDDVMYLTLCAIC